MSRVQSPRPHLSRISRYCANKMREQSTNYEKNSALFALQERQKLERQALFCNVLGIVSIGLSMASFSLDSWLAGHSDKMAAPMRWLPVYGIYLSGILCGIVALVVYRKSISAWVGVFLNLLFLSFYMVLSRIGHI